MASPSCALSCGASAKISPKKTSCKSRTGTLQTQLQLTNNCFLFPTFDSSVQDVVPRQIFFAEESFVALGALHGLLPVVYEPDVLGESGAPVEGAVARGTGVSVLAGVVENVRAQLGRLDEGLSAELAGVRLVARVGAQVTVQGFLRRKAVTTLEIIVIRISSFQQRDKVTVHLQELQKNIF